jgi:hypothetical protein
VGVVRQQPGAVSLFGGRYTDLGPFRAFAYPALLRLGMVDRNFGWTVKMQIRATRAGLRTLEVPVPYRRRIGQSKISGTFAGTVKAGWKILYVIGKYGWQNDGATTRTKSNGCLPTSRGSWAQIGNDLHSQECT